MQLREIMTTDVEVIRPETCVSQAAEKMRSLDVGALPVCEGQRLVGMVTDRNITSRAIAYGHDPNTTPVRQYMSSDLICCFEDQDINEAEELMRQRRVRVANFSGQHHGRRPPLAPSLTKSAARH